MPTTEESILQLVRQLYPTGRAWYLPEGGIFEGLHKALAISEAQAFEDAASIMDSLLPDTDRFTANDASDWERRLGLISNSATMLPARDAAIIQKLQAPGRNPAKGHYLYIEQQLQLAGFSVFVYENLDPIYGGGFNYFNPAVVNPAILSQSQHGDHQHGDIQSNYLNNVVISHINNSDDISTGFYMEDTFFIGGFPFGTYASVPATREAEFRQLILRLKQVQNVAILYINYP